jgi:hypothetical protein
MVWIRVFPAVAPRCRSGGWYWYVRTGLVGRYSYERAGWYLYMMLDGASVALVAVEVRVIGRAGDVDGRVAALDLAQHPMVRADAQHCRERAAPGHPPPG